MTDRQKLINFILDLTPEQADIIWDNLAAIIAAAENLDTPQQRETNT